MRLLCVIFAISASVLNAQNFRISLPRDTAQGYDSLYLSVLNSIPVTFLRLNRVSSGKWERSGSGVDYCVLVMALKKSFDGEMTPYIGAGIGAGVGYGEKPQYSVGCVGAISRITIHYGYEFSEGKFYVGFGLNALLPFPSRSMWTIYKRRM